MNVHPIFVHFPIALLTIYSLLELVPFKKITGQSYWFFVKASFVIIGTLASFAALFTGGMAEDEFGSGAEVHRLISIHSSLATVTVVVYCIISFAYAVSWLERENKFGKFAGTNIVLIALKLKSLIFSRYLLIFLSLAGLLGVTVTGALGGALVYGPNIDPVVNFVYHWFF